LQVIEQLQQLVGIAEQAVPLAGRGLAPWPSMS
jgi:hypothetical protein